MKKLVLFPLAIIYGIITGIRNKLFDWGILKSNSFNIPIISVGNLSMGGSGKSPHIEYLVRLLQGSNNVAILSRGYKRKTKGFKLVKQQASAHEIGDEPAQFKHKFKKATVAVDEKRVHGIKKLQQLADIIIITKMPKTLSPITKRRLYNVLKPMAHQSVFTTYLQYNKLHSLFTKEPAIEIKKYSSILLVSGIANPYPLEEYLRPNCNELVTLSYPDHHIFKQKDFAKIKKEYNNLYSRNSIIVTTEKDAMRIISNEENQLIKNLPLYYISVEIKFHNKQNQRFDSIINEYVTKNTRD